MENKSTRVQEMLDGLMKKYMARVPDVSGILKRDDSGRNHSESIGN